MLSPGVAKTWHSIAGMMIAPPGRVSARERKALDPFDFERLPQVNRALVHEFASGRYLDERGRFTIENYSPESSQIPRRSRCWKMGRGGRLRDTLGWAIRSSTPLSSYCN